MTTTLPTVDVQQGLPFDQYVAIEALNSSLIKVGHLKSMKHLYWEWTHPEPSTDSQILGIACHTAIFEPNELANRFFVFDKKRDLRTKAYQEALEEAGDREIIRSKDLQVAADMGLAVTSDPQVKPHIQSGKAEVTLITEEDGVRVKGRLDWVKSVQGFCDLKTANDIRAFAFGAAFFRYGYDISLGLYQRWLSRFRGQPEPCFVLCVESKPPYDVAVIPVAQPILDAGVDKARKIIRKYRECARTNQWPGIAGGEDYFLHVPHYEMDDELEWGEV